MSGTEAMQQTQTAGAPEHGCAMKLEVIVLPVSDVERTKRFYGDLGWRLDADIAPEPGFRIVQMTPPQSPASITFGEGITKAQPGSIDVLLLAVDDVEAARAELVSHGAEVSELFHGPGSGYRPAGSPQRAAGRDPNGGSYVSFATFSDPDGNGWLLQEIKERLPGRLWNEEG